MEKVECAFEHLPLHEQSCVICKKAVGDGDEPSVQKGEGGYADWVIVALLGLQEYL